MRKICQLLLVFLALTFLSCVGPATSIPSPRPEKPTEVAKVPTEQSPIPAETAQPTAGPTEAPPTRGVAAWSADGIISEGEYAHETSIGDVRLWWRNDAKYLYIAFEGKTNGWVAVGLDPERRMKGANYLIGLFSEGQAKVYDAYGTAEIGATHPADEELGGTSDIVAFAGAQEGGLTRFEVQIPLDSGDQYDKPLAPGGTYKVITALSGSAQFNAPHTARNSGQITLDKAP